MRCFTFVCLLTIVAALPYSQAAPAPKRTDAKPAVINAGTQKNIVWILENVVSDARIAVRENKEVADLPIVRRQKKDWEAWLNKNLRVERVERTNLVRVRFQDGNREEQVAIINAVVDYYLKNDIGSRRASLTALVKGSRQDLAELVARGKLTVEEVAKAEAGIKKREEYIRTLPALVEHAKDR
jgi:uncharacterized protein involved in exopolysaccharide biosynthesis